MGEDDGDLAAVAEAFSAAMRGVGRALRESRARMEGEAAAAAALRGEVERLKGRVVEVEEAHAAGAAALRHEMAALRGEVARLRRPPAEAPPPPPYTPPTQPQEPERPCDAGAAPPPYPALPPYDPAGKARGQQEHGRLDDDVDDDDDGAEEAPVPLVAGVEEGPGDDDPSPLEQVSPILAAAEAAPSASVDDLELELELDLDVELHDAGQDAAAAAPAPGADEPGGDPTDRLPTTDVAEALRRWKTSLAAAAAAVVAAPTPPPATAASSSSVPPPNPLLVTPPLLTLPQKPALARAFWSSRPQGVASTGAAAALPTPPWGGSSGTHELLLGSLGASARSGSHGVKPYHPAARRVGTSFGGSRRADSSSPDEADDGDDGDAATIIVSDGEGDGDATPPSAHHAADASSAVLTDEDTPRTSSSGALQTPAVEALGGGGARDEDSESVPSELDPDGDHVAPKPRPPTPKTPVPAEECAYAYLTLALPAPAGVARDRQPCSPPGATPLAATQVLPHECIPPLSSLTHLDLGRRVQVEGTGDVIVCKVRTHDGRCQYGWKKLRPAQHTPAEAAFRAKAPARPLPHAQLLHLSSASSSSADSIEPVPRKFVPSTAPPGHVAREL